MLLGVWISCLGRSIALCLVFLFVRFIVSSGFLGLFFFVFLVRFLYIFVILCFFSGYGYSMIIFIDGS